MGEAQIIHDDEFDTSGSTPKTGLYNSGSGYYNPHTGTFLGGSGAPASANPTSTSAEEPTAQSTRPASQLGAHAAISAVAGGVSSTKTVAASIDVEPEPTTTNAPVVEEFQGSVQISADFVDLSWGDEARRLNETDEEYAERVKRSWENRRKWESDMKAAEEKRKKQQDEDEKRREGWVEPEIIQNELPAEVWDYNSLPEELKVLLRKEYRNDHPETKDLSDKDIDDNLELELEFVLWTGEGAGTALVGYKLKGQCPVFFNSSGQRVDLSGDPNSVLNNAMHYASFLNGEIKNGRLKFRNFTGKNISIIFTNVVDYGYTKCVQGGFKIFLPSQTNGNQSLYGNHCDLPLGLGGPADMNGENMFGENNGDCTIAVAYEDGRYERYNAKNGNPLGTGQLNIDGYFYRGVFFNVKLGEHPQLCDIKSKSRLLVPIIINGIIIGYTYVPYVTP